MASTAFEIQCRAHFTSGTSDVPAAEYPKTTRCPHCGRRAKVRAITIDTKEA